MTEKNKELLFNLLKAKDKGEIGVIINGSGAVFLKERGSAQSIFFFQIEENNSIDFADKEPAAFYEEKYNDKFKENFYQEKGLINCWYKDCPNKIYQTENDYKKVKIKCEEKHTRIICLNHNK